MKKILQSFENNKLGYSGRKASAFWAIVVVATIISFKHTDISTVFEIVCAWLIFACMCLGLVTAQNVIEFKKGVKDENNQQKDEESESHIN